METLALLEEDRQNRNMILISFVIDNNDVQQETLTIISILANKKIHDFY